MAKVTKKQNYDIPEQYLGAFKAGHRPQVREYIDEELSLDLLKKIKRSNFTDKESMEALAYIAKFNNEYYKRYGLGKEDALHKTPEQKKDIYNRLNAADRDIMSYKKDHRTAMDSSESHIDTEESPKAPKMKLGSAHTSVPNYPTQEDVMIALMDFDTSKELKSLNIDELDKKKSKK